MVFSSLIFLYAFLPACLILYYLLGKPFRNLVILVTSLFFYAWGEGLYIAVMGVTIVANYAFARVIDDAEGQRRKTWTAAAVTANLLLLGVFKYTDFVIASLAPLAQAIGLEPPKPVGVHLPIGISFFTFQAISYVLDVSRRDVAASRRIIDYAAYKAFFPQLIAGPIVRYRDIADELARRRPTLADFASGVERFVIGLAKKVLIADIVAVPADQIFGLPADSLDPGLAWLGVLCYALQIYFDFSAYSDMAIGLGRMFGFHFLENFRHPYASASMREFWQRWHISLSTWFRDYLYRPLGGSRHGQARTLANLLAVFLLSGLWHGAAWTFVAWGAWHGLFVALEHAGLMRWATRWKPFAHVYVWVVMLVGWVFFRADSVHQAGAFIVAMVDVTRPLDLASLADAAGIEVWAALAAGMLGAVGVGVRLVALAERWAEAWRWSRPAWLGLRLAACGAAFQVSAAVTTITTFSPFIYFRF